MSESNEAREGNEVEGYWARIAEVHDDANALLALSDWLQHRNDPWGELIALQHALQSSPRALASRRARELREAQLKEQHLGPLARFVSLWGAPSESKPLELHWRTGRIDRAIFHHCCDDTMSQILNAFLALPSARLTRALTLDLGRMERIDLPVHPDKLLNLSGFLKELIVWGPLNSEFSWGGVPLDALARLERLHLGAGSLTRSQTRALSPRLTHLGMMAKEDTSDLLTVRWDKLESLCLWGFHCPPSAYSALINALAPERLPALRSLRLCGFRRADLFAQTWLQSDRRPDLTFEQCGFDALPEEKSSLRFCERALWRHGSASECFRRALIAFQEAEQGQLHASTFALLQSGFELSLFLPSRSRPQGAMTAPLERFMRAGEGDRPGQSSMLGCAIHDAQPEVRASLLTLRAQQKFGLQKERLLQEVELYTAPRTVDPVRPSTLYFQARVERVRLLLLEGRGADALNLARALFTPPPSAPRQHREAHWILGQCYRRLAQYTSAEKALRAALEHAEDQPAHRVILEASLAVLELDQGHFAAARPVLEETLSRCTFEGAQTAATSIRAQLARCLRKLDDPLRALQTIEHAGPQTVADPDLRAGLIAEHGLALHALGRKAEGGERLLQSAIVLEKLGRAAQAIERFLELAELRVNDGEHDAARALFERAQGLFLEDQMPKEKARFDQLRALMRRSAAY